VLYGNEEMNASELPKQQYEVRGSGGQKRAVKWADDKKYMGLRKWKYYTYTVLNTRLHAAREYGRKRKVKCGPAGISSATPLPLTGGKERRVARSGSRQYVPATTE
jgi:hypothetical protein